MEELEHENSDGGTARSNLWDRWNGREGHTSLVRPVRTSKKVYFEALPEPIEVDLAASALIIIDMQNDFLDPNGWFAKYRGQDVSALLNVIDPINALATAFREQKAPVIHLNWGVRSDIANLPANVADKASGCGSRIGYGDKSQMGHVLVEGDWGSLSIEPIVIEDSDFRVSKHRLSGFCDNELDQLLRRLGVTTLFFTGVNIDRCVFATLMDGSFQGYDPILVEDACQTPSPDFVSDAILYLVRLLYGFTAKSEQILAAIRSQIPTTIKPQGEIS